MTALVSVNGSGVFANSRDVADKFQKQHMHVLRDIDDLIRQDVPGFVGIKTTVQMPNGGTRMDRAFDMNRDAFMILAMGFTGKQALRWKLRYIEAFNAMEEQLRHPVLIEQGLRAELDQLKADIAWLKATNPMPRRLPFDSERMVLRYIKAKEVMPRGLLSRKVDGRITVEELDEVCASLERAGKIETLRIENTGGRPATIYVAC